MKKTILPLIIILIFSTWILTACSKTEAESPAELKSKTIFRYGTVEMLPMRILRHENGNTVLFSDFERSYSKIARGYADNSGNERVLYEADPGCVIENFTANDRYITWFERREGSADTNTYTLYLYDTETDEKTNILEKRVDFKKFQAQSTDLELSGDTLFYVNYNYDSNESEIVGYQITSGTSFMVASIPFSNREEYMRHSISFLTIHDNWLISNTAGDSQSLSIYDLSTIPQGETTGKSIALTGDIDYVFSGDYDPQTNTFALYLRTKSGEIKLVLFTEEDQKMTDVYTLAEDEMLHRDGLVIDAKCVYYVIRRNTRANISEHFNGFAYDRKTTKMAKATRCFSLEPYAGKIYGLTFDRNPLKKGIGSMEYEFQ
jgi:hypothetical protein